MFFVFHNVKKIKLCDILKIVNYNVCKIYATNTDLLLLKISFHVYNTLTMVPKVLNLCVIKLKFIFLPFNHY